MSLSPPPYRRRQKTEFSPETVEKPMNLTQDQIQTLLADIRNISHGGQPGPLGLESVTMALGGEGPPGHDSVASGLHDIAGAIRELAVAISETRPQTP